MKHSKQVLVVVLAVALVLAVCVARARKAAREGFATRDTIFVSIASYRDKGCMATVRDMFAKARYPDRIFAGICEQNTGDAGEACTSFKNSKNVRTISIPHTEAKGPTYARYLCSTLYRGETYFCQIDSHTKFVKDWDAVAIDELGKCKSKKAVLSGYPHSDTHDLGERSVPILCESSWNASGIPQLKASVKSANEVARSPEPSPIPFTSGGFIFGPGGMLREVPYDPGLPDLFVGEEVLYTARLWTSGYDIYSAKRNIVFHFYVRKGAARWHNDRADWKASQRASESRVRRILGLEEPAIKPGEDAYGLGRARAIAEYWAYSGLDPATKTSSSRAKFC